MPQSIKKIIVSFLVASFILLPFAQAQAFIVHDFVHTIVTSGFSALSTASQAVTNFSVGLPGTGSAAAGTFKAGKVSCNVLNKTLEAADMADLANISTAVIGEGYVKVTKLTVKYNALKAAKICLELFNTMIESGDIVMAGMGQQAITSFGFNKTTLAIGITDISRKMDSVKESLNQAWAEVWKAITVRLLMQAQQKITTNLVNGLVDKYKISNYTQYANAVASQVYSYQYLKQNSTKGADQMILRSMLPGGNGKKIAMPMIKAKADSAFGQKVDLVALDDPNFFKEMAAKGSRNANPSFQEYIAESGASEVAAKAQAKASEEIAAGNGFKASWDCKESRQQIVDAETAKLSKQVEIDYAAYDDLLTQYELDPQGVEYNEVKTAENAYNFSKDKLESYAEAEKDAKSPCELLNPASVIAKSTSDILGAHLNATANMKDANLPFFAKFIESTAGNLLNNIIGKAGKGFNSLSESGTTQVKVAEADVVQVNKATDKLKEDFTDAQRDNVVFEGVKTGAEANEFKLQWDAENYVGVENATNASVQITGPLGLDKTFKSLSGTMIIGNPNGGTYTLKVTVNSQVVSVKSWIMPKSSDPNFVAPSEVTIDDAIGAAQDKTDETKALLPTDPCADPNSTDPLCGNGTSTSGSGSVTDYPQKCNVSYGSDANTLQNCLDARGVGYVQGASTTMKIILRDASGAALKFLFGK